MCIDVNLHSEHRVDVIRKFSGDLRYIVVELLIRQKLADGPLAVCDLSGDRLDVFGNILHAFACTSCRRKLVAYRFQALFKHGKRLVELFILAVAHLREPLGNHQSIFKQFRELVHLGFASSVDLCRELRDILKRLGQKLHKVFGTLLRVGSRRNQSVQDLRDLILIFLQEHPLDKPVGRFHHLGRLVHRPVQPGIGPDIFDVAHLSERRSGRITRIKRQDIGPEHTLHHLLQLCVLVDLKLLRDFESELCLALLKTYFVQLSDDDA